MIQSKVSNSSFRDPSGFIFINGDILYRQVNRSYQRDFDVLTSSGLHQDLVQADLLVGFETANLDLAMSSEAIAILKPEPIPFISYPYEWCFSQLKDAALLTLEIMQHSIAKGMVLKDATAYNVQFIGCRPIFIDTLSFEVYEEGQPWVAYRQFCQHFLAPLALMSYIDPRLISMLATNLDGIPLDIASSLLPGKTKFKPGLLTHIHLHAKAQGEAAATQKAQSSSSPHISKNSLLALVDSLKGTVSSLSWQPSGTEWGDYYSATNYSSDSFSEKHNLVKEFLAQVPDSCKTCWDLGANNGEFSRLAVERGLNTVAWDIDPAAVEKCYLAGKSAQDSKLLPLQQDLRNPSPNLGWANAERDSFVDRGPADVILALALVHHLAIGNNVPLPLLAKFLHGIGEWMIVEFVPKVDSQVVRMLVSRKDIFENYNEAGFEESIAVQFKIVSKKQITGTSRTLYLLQRNPL